jgi:hypothetical protein
MTEIKIEKKKLIWPWLLLLLGVLAAILFFFLRDDKAEYVDTAENTELIDVYESNEVVATYITFIDSSPDDMGLDHEFTHEAITKLTNAVDAMAAEVNYDVSAEITKAKQYADEITTDPLAGTHSDKVRNAAEVLSTSLQNLQQAKYAGLNVEAEEVRAAAMAIDPTVLTLDQKDAVKTFFTKAADLLTKMN